MIDIFCFTLVLMGAAVGLMLGYFIFGRLGRIDEGQRHHDDKIDR